MIIILFTVLDAYTSINIDTMSLDLTKRNFSKAINWSLGDLTKNIVFDRNNMYKPRGAMHGAKRCGLRAATGH